MTTSSGASARRGTGNERAQRVIETCCAVAGLAGSALCSFAMVAAAVGLFTAAGATASHSSMAGMGSMRAAAQQEPEWLQAIVRFGPEILIASLLLLALGIGTRRRSALVPIALGGAVLYAGMYVQRSLTWMYVAIAVGTALLLLAWVSTLRSRRVAPPMVGGSIRVRRPEI